MIVHITLQHPTLDNQLVVINEMNKQLLIYHKLTDFILKKKEIKLQPSNSNFELGLSKIVSENMEILT